MNIFVCGGVFFNLCSWQTCSNLCLYCWGIFYEFILSLQVPHQITNACHTNCHQKTLFHQHTLSFAPKQCYPFFVLKWTNSCNLFHKNTCQPWPCTSDIFNLPLVPLHGFIFSHPIQCSFLKKKPLHWMYRSKLFNVDLKENLLKFCCKLFTYSICKNTLDIKIFENCVV
jgi:hypothetical protein